MIKAIVLLVVLLFFGTFLVSAYLSPDDLAKCGDTPNAKEGCEKADAIVAVSGGNTSDRAKEAIELYQLGWADVLVFSGAAKDTSGPSNAEAMAQQAVRSGVPEAAIIIEEASQTTKQNAEETEALLDSSVYKRVILVTSGYHQRRAGLEFRASVGESVTVLNHPTSYDDDWTAWWWTTPRGWWLAASEIVKIMMFHMGKSQ
ncbi:MAG TPA: YdcF family protein [Candidatus Saccharibacteria bacterium]|nr:YdcF family protein [Candidatus Saccharibacteria bacterium]